MTGSLHVFADALKRIAVVVGVPFFEVQRRAEASGAVATRALIHALALELERERVADGRSLAREREESPQAAHFLDNARVLVLNLMQAVLEV